MGMFRKEWDGCEKELGCRCWGASGLGSRPASACSSSSWGPASSEEFGEGVPMELLCAYGLVLIAEAGEVLLERMHGKMEGVLEWVLKRRGSCGVRRMGGGRAGGSGGRSCDVCGEGELVVTWSCVCVCLDGFMESVVAFRES